MTEIELFLFVLISFPIHAFCTYFHWFDDFSLFLALYILKNFHLSLIGIINSFPLSICHVTFEFA